MEIEHDTTSLNEVRLAVLRQHTQLRQLLDELEQHANAVVGGAVADRAKPLDDALGLLLTRFSRHLDYEEVHLGRWLAAGGRGKLLGDHEDQRRRLRGLAHDRDVFDDPRTVAREALAFIHLLRTDMAEEEAELRALG